MRAASVERVNTRLRALADPERAAATARYFKAVPGGYGEGDRFLGIRVPELRRLVRELGDVSIDDTARLLDSEFHEARLLALLILVRAFERGDGAAQKRIYDLYLARTDRINNWDLVDVSAPHIVGGYLAFRSRRPLRRLARSKSVWERRIAIIATLRFIRGYDFDDALEIAELLIHDSHDLIHRAAGWMLREIGNRDRRREEAFLRAHCREMPRTMLRYAVEKFPEPLRKRYLAGSVSIR